MHSVKTAFTKKNAYLLILISFILGLIGISKPLYDHHPWRQCATAALSNNYFEEDMNIFYPRVDVRGNTNGNVGET